MTEKQLGLAGRHWVNACRFHPHSGAEVLEEVFQRAISQKQSWVLLDLDSTLYEVGPRSYQILTDWAKSDQSEIYPYFRKRILEMDPEQIGYSVKDTFRNLSSEGESSQI